MRKFYLLSAMLLVSALLFASARKNGIHTVISHFFAPHQALLKGKVLNEEGLPLKGASIIAKGSNVSAITNANGEFEIGVVANEGLIISYIGYQTQEIGYNGSDFLLITLLLKKDSLEEVVVEANTGYQKLPRERITGSIDIIAAKQFSKKAPLKLTERLEGLTPGLLLINGKDNGSDDALTIRGVSTLYGTKRPLIVVDNFPIDGDINSINPNDVASVTVLKDAGAASRWGARAANGVIVITTKKAIAGPVSLNYTNNFQFSPKPDLKKLGRLSSPEDVDTELQLVDSILSFIYREHYRVYTFNPISVLYVDLIDNRITPEVYKTKLDELRGLDNEQQIKDLLMQTPFTQSHTISLNGGNEISRFYGSLIYTHENSYALRDKKRNISAFIKNNTKIGNRLKLNTTFNYTRTTEQEAPVDPEQIFRYKPYMMLQDAGGNPLSIIANSDPVFEQNPSNVKTIKERKDWGLEDEAYFPLLEVKKRDINFSGNLARIQTELQYEIAKGINASVSYQYENKNGIKTDFKHQNNAEVAKIINDFTAPEYDDDGNIITDNAGKMKIRERYVPRGGIISELRNELASYTLRGILELNKNIGARSNISVLAGGERTKLVETSSLVTLYGFDARSLQSVDINENFASYVDGVLQDIVRFDGGRNKLAYEENRFVSAFANAAYTFDNKYVVSGSVRMDATNLFGTDPKFRYKPLWSTGLSWHLGKENFFKNNLFDEATLRATFGINGNVPKKSGPFVLAKAEFHRLLDIPALNVISPANGQLRWEATKVLNLGFDFGLLNRISGKFDYYIRNSSDLLAAQRINSTYGFNTLLLNSGSMINRGFEVQIVSKNIARKNFEWSTNFMFSRTKNKITKVATNDLYNQAYFRASAFVDGPLFVEGYPYGPMFSFKFAGLSDQGQVLIYDQAGKITTGSADDGLISDLGAIEYSGNTRPFNTASFGNQIRFKNFEVSLLFVGYGSYFLRRGLPNVGSIGNINSYDPQLRHAWKMPGDENKTNIPSIFINKDYSSIYAMEYYRYFLNAHVFDAAYIKLREVILTYNLPSKFLSRLNQIDGIQINVQGRNLWTIVKNNRGVDPEAFSGGSPELPIMPTFIFGLNVNL